MSHFQTLQHVWTSWLRQSEHYPMPEGIESRRLAIYRELVFNNITSFIDNGFPLLKQQLPESFWQYLQQQFFAQYRCQSPYFYDIAGEFLQFLQQLPVPAEYPWLIELAHFEWAELAADVADLTMPAAIQGDFWQQIPVLTPYVWPLVYQWPVHQFATQHHQHITPEVNCLLLFRNVEDQVELMILNPLIALFIEKLQNNMNDSGEQILHDLSTQTGHEYAALFQLIQPLVTSWQKQKIILGVRP